jgi:hypothetical protein
MEPVRPEDHVHRPLDRELPAPEWHRRDRRAGPVWVNGDCSVIGERQNGLATSSGRFQADNRGIIGRVFVDDGERSFGGWFVAQKRG